MCHFLVQLDDNGPNYVQNGDLFIVWRILKEALRRKPTKCLTYPIRDPDRASVWYSNSLAAVIFFLQQATLPEVWSEHPGRPS